VSTRHDNECDLSCTKSAARAFHATGAEAYEDEEVEREYWLTEIRHASLQSLQLLGTLTQEQELLAGMLKRMDTDIDDVQAQAEGAKVAGAEGGWGCCCLATQQHI
jgi:TAP42-like family